MGLDIVELVLKCEETFDIELEGRKSFRSLSISFR